MSRNIIGVKVFTVISMWTANDGYFKEPKVCTTLIKAQNEMKKQVKEFVSEHENSKLEVDVCETNAFVSGEYIDSCSWDIFETEII